jgi:hypothetical protein
LRVRKTAENLLASIFLDQDIDWRTFSKKTLLEFQQVCFALSRQCPSSQSTCNPRETGISGLPISWSPILFSWSDPDRTPNVPWTKKHLKIRHFSPTSRALLPRTLGWRDIFWNFLKCLAKFVATG